MNRFTNLIIATAVLLASFGLASAADKKPDATFDLTGGSVAAGVGYTWGSGILHYNGRDYPFSLKGLTVLNVGATKANAHGGVYNLSKLEDFAGSYSGVGAGAAAVYGASAGVMENHTGVVLRFDVDTAGAELKLAADTIEVKLR